MELVGGWSASGLQACVKTGVRPRRPGHAVRSVQPPGVLGPTEAWRAAQEAGATPVVLAGEQALSYLGEHGLPVPQLAAWAELPGFLLAQRARPPAELDAEQAALQAAYRRLMRRVRDAASRAVCGLADG
jgi:hypothetical protein